MFRKSVPVIIVLAICAIVSSNQDQKNDFDCRQYPYYPKCRGIVNKREHQNDLHQGFISDAISIKELLKNFNEPFELQTTDRKGEVSSLRRPTLQEQTDNGTFKNDQLQPDPFLLKLLIGNNRRKNNQVDNISPFDYDDYLL